MISFLWMCVMNIQWIQDVELLEFLFRLVLGPHQEMIAYEPVEPQAGGMFIGRHRMPGSLIKYVGYLILVAMSLYCVVHFLILCLYSGISSITVENLRSAGCALFKIYAALKFLFGIISKLSLWLYTTVPNQPLFGYIPQYLTNLSLERTRIFY